MCLSSLAYLREYGRDNNSCHFKKKSFPPRYRVWHRSSAMQVSSSASSVNTRQENEQFAMRASLKYRSLFSLPSPAVAPVCGLSLGHSPGALISTKEQMKVSATQLCAVPAVTVCQRGINNVLQMPEVHLWLLGAERVSELHQCLVHKTWKISLGCVHVTVQLQQGRI